MKTQRNSNDIVALFMTDRVAAGLLNDQALPLSEKQAAWLDGQCDREGIMFGLDARPRNGRMLARGRGSWTEASGARLDWEFTRFNSGKGVLKISRGPIPAGVDEAGKQRTLGLLRELEARIEREEAKENANPMLLNGLYDQRWELDLELMK